MMGGGQGDKETKKQKLDFDLSNSVKKASDDSQPDDVVPDDNFFLCNKICGKDRVRMNKTDM